MNLTFDAPNGLRYDVVIHDFIEADGTLASDERVAEAWGITVSEVRQDREEFAALKARAAHEGPLSVCPTPNHAILGRQKKGG
jgi:hypothetical protein